MNSKEQIFKPLFRYKIMKMKLKWKWNIINYQDIN